jgi:hypothetical protein
VIEAEARADGIEVDVLYRTGFSTFRQRIDARVTRPELDAVVSAISARQ